MSTSPLAIWANVWRDFRVFVLLPAAILVSGANDLRYSLWGKTTDAKLIRATRGTWKEPNNQAVFVEYAFVDDVLGKRTERDKLPYWFDVPAGKTVAVRYIEGSDGSSRVEGNRDWYWMFALVFLAGIGLILALIVYWPEREAASDDQALA